MARALKMPTNRAMKISPDCWDIAIEAAIAKGVTPRSVVEGLLRTCTPQWVGGEAPKPSVSVPPAPAPFNAADGRCCIDRGSHHENLITFLRQNRDKDTKLCSLLTRREFELPPVLLSYNLMANRHTQSGTFAYGLCREERV